MPTSFIIGLTLVASLSLIGVVADILIKKAGEGVGLAHPGLFICGLLLYALTAFGWFVAMKWMKLSTIGVLYPLMTMLLLVAGGVLFFREHLTPRELVGVTLAFLAIILLARFS